MITEKIAVLFDTNAYRQLVRDKVTKTVLKEIDDIRQLEKLKNIKAFGVLTVGTEMLGNLAEGEKGNNYKDCLNGIIAMANHCYDENVEHVRIIPQPYLHISRSYFNTVSTNMESRIRNWGGIINDFRVDYDKAIEFHKKEETFNNVKKYIEKEEEGFSKNIIKLIDGAKHEVLKRHPNIAAKQLREKHLEFIEKEFELVTAMTIVAAVAIELNVQLPFEEYMNKVNSIIAEFPISVGFIKWISYKIVRDNIDMQSKRSREKRWNWNWDYQVSFLLSKHTIDGRKTILVTSDGDLVQLLNEFGYKKRVMNMQEYFDFLKA